jgi:hypothetical protein
VGQQGGGGGGPVGGVGGKPAAQIVGGGAGELKPLAGGGWMDKNGQRVGNARPTTGRNSESSTR